MHQTGHSDVGLTLFDASGRTIVRLAYQPSVELEYQVQHVKVWKPNIRGKEKGNLRYASDDQAQLEELHHSSESATLVNAK